MGDDSLFGLTVFQQLALVGGVGVLFVLVGYASSSPIDPGYAPTVVLVGLVAVLYALARAGYELFSGSGR